MSSAPTVNASSQEAHICPTKKLYKVHPTFENCPLDWESNTSTEYNNKSKDTRTKVVLARILEKQGPSSTPDSESAKLHYRTVLQNCTAGLRCRTALKSSPWAVNPFSEQSTTFLSNQPLFWAVNNSFQQSNPILIVIQPYFAQKLSICLTYILPKTVAALFLIFFHKICIISWMYWQLPFCPLQGWFYRNVFVRKWI